MENMEMEVMTQDESMMDDDLDLNTTTDSSLDLMSMLLGGFITLAGGWIVKTIIRLIKKIFAKDKDDKPKTGLVAKLKNKKHPKDDESSEPDDQNETTEE